MAGEWYEPGTDEAEVCFQPLAAVDEESDAAWALEWVCEMMRLEKVDLGPRAKTELWEALQNVRALPPAQRTLSTLYNLVQNDEIRMGLRNYTVDGAHGQLLDADHDSFSGSGHGDTGPSWIGIEMQHLMQRKAVAVPVLTYLFHKLQQRFDGRPTLLVLDEAWLYLADTLFAAKVHEWLKTLRKANVAVVFATQSLADVATSAIAPAILENCLTRIYLPNSAALEPATRAIYESFGLNLRQVQILSEATPKRDYYYCSRQGNRLFQLDLGEIQKGLCGRSRPEDLTRLNAFRQQDEPDWLAAWLNTAEVAGSNATAIPSPGMSHLPIDLPARHAKPSSHRHSAKETSRD